MIPRLFVVVALLALMACGAAPVPPEPDVAPMVDLTSSKLKAIDTGTKVTGTYPTSCRARDPLPDPKCAPGSVSPAVTQDTIKKTICVSGYTQTVRPNRADSGRAKTKLMKIYGLARSSSATTELDHLVPLELGGSNDVSNLWPEASDLPGKGFRNTKDGVEGRIRSAVCAGRVTLRRAQTEIARDWTTAEARLGVK